ncbi:MAG: hypothetical protein PVF27_06250 [Gemmatimonadales bacterium]|jgi:hypothetical protein
MRGTTISLSTLAIAVIAVSAMQAQDAPAAPTVDVTGEWEFQMETPRGTRTTRLVFQQDGNALTGEIETRRGAVAISRGSVSGNRITFTIRIEVGQRSFERTYAGTVEEDTASGTVTNPRGGTTDWTARKVR